MIGLIKLVTTVSCTAGFHWFGYLLFHAKKKLQARSERSIYRLSILQNLN